MLADSGLDNNQLTLIDFQIGGNGVFAKNLLGTSWDVLEGQNMFLTFDLIVADDEMNLYCK